METQILNFVVGVAGFEPTTFCSQSRRDTGLRYTPKIFANIRTSSVFAVNSFETHSSSMLFKQNELVCLAERGGFEPPVRVTPYDSLANCWFQPLTHLSRWFPIFRRENVIHIFCLTSRAKKKVQSMKHFVECPRTKGVICFFG